MSLKGFRYKDKVPKRDSIIWVKRGKGKVVLVWHEGEGWSYINGTKEFRFRPNHLWAYPVAPEGIEVGE